MSSSKPIDFDELAARALRHAHYIVQELLHRASNREPLDITFDWQTGKWSDSITGQHGSNLIELTAFRLCQGNRQKAAEELAYLLEQALWHDRSVKRTTKRDIRNDLLFAASRIPHERRRWLSLREIAKAHARISGAFVLDTQKYDAVVETLRQQVLQGLFVDCKGRSRIAHLTDEPNCPYRFNHNMASLYFRKMLERDELWMRREDAIGFFQSWGVPFPAELAGSDLEPDEASKVGYRALLVEPEDAGSVDHRSEDAPKTGTRPIIELDGSDLENAKRSALRKVVDKSPSGKERVTKAMAELNRGGALDGEELDEKIKEAIRTAIARDPVAKGSGKKQAAAAMRILGDEWGVKKIRGSLRARVDDLVELEEFKAQRGRLGVTNKSKAARPKS